MMTKKDLLFAGFWEKPEDDNVVRFASRCSKKSLSGRAKHYIKSW